MVLTGTVFTKIIGHVGHFRWLGPNVWWEISQIWIEYIKPIGQMSDEPWKFFMNTAGRYQSPGFPWGRLSATCTRVVSGVRDGGILPKLATCPQILERVGADPPYLTKSYIAIVSDAPFSVDRAPPFLRYWGGFPLKTWTEPCCTISSVEKLNQIY